MNESGKNPGIPRRKNAGTSFLYGSGTINYWSEKSPGGRPQRESRRGECDLPLLSYSSISCISSWSGSASSGSLIFSAVPEKIFSMSFTAWGSPMGAGGSSWPGASSSFTCPWVKNRPSLIWRRASLISSTSSLVSR